MYLSQLLVRQTCDFDMEQYGDDQVMTKWVVIESTVEDITLITVEMNLRIRIIGVVRYIPPSPFSVTTG